MSRRQFDTSAPARAETTHAHQTEVPEADMTHSAFHDPLAPVASGACGMPFPQAQTAALSQASGGQLTRAGRSLLQLQRMYGNRYVQQIVNQSRHLDNRTPVTQTKQHQRATTTNGEDQGWHLRAIQRLPGNADSTDHQENATDLPIVDCT